MSKYVLVYKGGGAWPRTPKNRRRPWTQWMNWFGAPRRPRRRRGQPVRPGSTVPSDGSVERWAAPAADRLLDHRGREPLGGGGQGQGMPGPLRRRRDRGLRGDADRMSGWSRSVDVVVQIDIAAPRAEVSTYASDPDHAMSWYKNIISVDWVTEPPVTVGSRIVFGARFLGRRLSYTYEVTALDPGERFVMSTVDGPFPMETTYEWEDDGVGTRIRLRNRGQASGFSAFTTPLLTGAMRRANRKDLARLKAVLETPSD